MKTIYYKDYDILIKDIVEKFNNLDEYKSIDIIVKYNEAKKLIKELICFGCDICSIDIEEPEYDCYYDEYVVTLSDSGIWCEKFKRETGYITIDDNVVFVSNDCNSKCLKKIFSDKIYAFEIIDEIEMLEDGEIEFCNCDNCCGCKYGENNSHTSISDIIHRDEDTGIINGFTKTWSDYADDYCSSHTYSYFDDDVSHLRKIARIFDVDF